MALNSLICAAIMTLLTHTHSLTHRYSAVEWLLCRWMVDVGCCSVDVVRESDVWRGHVDGSRQWKLSSVDSEKCHIVVRHKRCGSAATTDQTYKCSAATKCRREWHALRSVGGALYCSTTQHIDTRYWYRNSVLSTYHIPVLYCLTYFFTTR